MDALSCENKTKKLGFVCTEGRLDAVDLKIVVIQMLQYFVQLLEMGVKGSVGNESNVVDETDHVFHVGEEG